MSEFYSDFISGPYFVCAPQNSPCPNAGTFSTGHPVRLTDSVQASSYESFSCSAMTLGSDDDHLNERTTREDLYLYYRPADYGEEESHGI